MLPMKISLRLFIAVLGLSVLANTTTQPNVLIMLIDDLGWTDISCHGAEYETKNICSLIENGIELTNYYVHLVCSPTRSALMTGQYSFKNGLQNRSTIQAGTAEHIPWQNPTLPELLRKAGYTNHMLGKWHLGYAAWNMTPTGRGFDSHFGYFQGAEDYYTHEIANGYDFFDNRQVDFAANDTYSIDLYFNRFQQILMDYNKTAKDKPLFLYMAFQTVHSPIENPPKLYAECQNISHPKRKSYCQKMVDLDNTINDMVNLYKQYNLWDDTLLVVSTDNGGMPYWSNQTIYWARSWGCNMPFRAGKATLFQGGVKGIGFINGGNNVIPANIRGTGTNILSHVIDWLPTIVEGVIGETLPDNVPFDGRNMWNSIINPYDPTYWNRTTLFLDIENNGSFAGVIDNNNNLKYFQGQPLYTGYFPCDQSAVYDNTTEYSVTEWLFDIYKDPYETNNLAKTNPDLVNKYKQMIDDFVQNGGYIPEQNPQFYIESSPNLHNGSWSPWLD